MRNFLKQNKSLVVAVAILAVVVGVISASSVKADYSFKELLADKVALVLGDKLAEELGFGEEILGASGTRFPNGISADTTSPIAGQVRGTTLEITGNDFGLGGVDTYAVTGSCTDATTTPIAIANPFSATSTVVYAQVHFTGATSTFDVDMGVSTTAFRDGAGDGLIDGLAIATSSQVSIVNGDTNAGTNSKANILVDPTEYITAKFTPREAAKESSLYDIGNTFECTYSFVFQK